MAEKILSRPPSDCLKKLIARAELKEKELPQWLKDYYDSLKRSLQQCIDIASGTCCQTEELWFQERSVKVTGSKIYGLYTYISNKNPNWKKKLDTVFNSSFNGNEATVYGLQCEPVAREKYATFKNVSVVEPGLFSRPELPMVGYSGDGVVEDDSGEPVELLEIKSLVVGKTNPASKLFSVASCCNKKTKKLKEKHPYFGQIQLGMLLYGLPSCDFMLHSSVANDKTIAYQTVPFDEVFTFNMVSKIIDLYFEEILPWLFHNRKSTPPTDEV